MPNGLQLEKALDLLRAELVTEQAKMTEWTTRAAWLAFMRFGRRRFDAAATPDSDGLLFQYGTYAFSGRPMFTVDLTRQFDVTDDDGEHVHYVQVHCELRYEPEPDLKALGSFDSWFFHDAGADLDEWFAAVEGRLALLLGRRPSEIDLHEEPV
ncbi:hypothetical protein ACFXOD_35990 [Streptomyces sp. NPDC059161]|uniref:hypothetical protein n=1 Tax=Streptomyces sp. NPDC059161 TaxID=3346749 RepID=UPI00368E70FD